MSLTLLYLLPITSWGFDPNLLLFPEKWCHKDKSQYLQKPDTFFLAFPPWEADGIECRRKKKGCNDAWKFCNQTHETFIVINCLRFPIKSELSKQNKHINFVLCAQGITKGQKHGWNIFWQIQNIFFFFMEHKGTYILAHIQQQVVLAVKIPTTLFYIFTFQQ